MQHAVQDHEWTSPAALAGRLIRYDTSNRSGAERQLLEWIRPRLEAAGFQVEMRARDPMRPNLIARFPGRGAAPPLLLHGHIDVVPATGQRWSVDPFGGEVRDGVLWGRGALDMKGGVAMILFAALRAASASPPGDIIVALLSDEERGGDFGARFLVEKHPELFDGVHHAIGEAGGFTFNFAGRRLYPIQVQEKQRSIIRLTARGQAGHGALGSADQALNPLARAIGILTTTPLPVHVTPTTRAVINAIAEVAPPIVGGVLRGLRYPKTSPMLLRALGSRGTALGRMLRDTASVTVVSAGDEPNVVPEEAMALVDCRILPGRDTDDLIADLRRILPTAIDITVDAFDRGEDRVDWSLYPRLVRLLEKADPDGHPVPMLQAAVTDGRHFARLGIQHYGFLPMRLPEDISLTALIHGADERVPVTALDFGTHLLTELISTYRGTAS